MPNGSITALVYSTSTCPVSLFDIHAMIESETLVCKLGSSPKLFLLLLLGSITLLVTACVVVEPPASSVTGSLETAAQETPEPVAAAAAPESSESELPEVESSESGSDDEADAASKAGILGGTTWSLFAYGDSAALSAMAADSKITAEFSADGNLSGSAGCNRYMTTFQVEGEQVSVGPVGLTRAMCADEALRLQEQQFVAALESLGDARPYRLVADQLEIELGDGNMLIFQTQ